MTLGKLATAALLLAGCATGVADRPAATLAETIAGIQQFAAHEGDRLWPGYGSAPFGFLLIEQDGEMLYCRDSIPDGFAEPVRDPATGCQSARRDRSDFPANLLAAMPLFGPPSTIVMGTPEETGRTPAEWTRTILHEHFHQWQAELPEYYARVAALGLSGGDETGMWMLNYPFPYAEPAAVTAYAEASRALVAAVRTRGTSGFSAPRWIDTARRVRRLPMRSVQTTGATPNSSCDRKESRAGPKSPLAKPIATRR